MAEAKDDPAAEPSMEDILSSIRRILNEDQGETGGPAAGVEAAELLLDASMLAAGVNPARNRSDSAMPEEEPPDFSDVGSNFVADADAAPASYRDPPQADYPGQAPTAPLPADAAMGGLVGAPVAQAVAGLFGRLASERQAVIGRSGVTIEDVVRDALRLLLQAWLETHLPPLVERLVREELARISGGARA